MKKLRFAVTGLSDVGKKRSNEDSYVYKVIDAGDYYAGIFAVADGVGGLDRGDLASAKAISDLNKWWESEFKYYYHDQAQLIQSLIAKVQETNVALIQFANRNSIKIATTLSVLLIHRKNSIIVHIGDSRIYKVQVSLNTRIIRLTEDHSCYILREIKGRKVRKQVLTECLGNKEAINYYFMLGDLHKNDIYLVCSDGIYKTIPDTQIMGTVKKNRHDVKKICTKLIDTAKVNGETDNISIIAIKITD